MGPKQLFYVELDVGTEDQNPMFVVADDTKDAAQHYLLAQTVNWINDELILVRPLPDPQVDCEWGVLAWDQLPITRFTIEPNREVKYHDTI